MKNIIFAFAFLLALPVFAADTASIDSIASVADHSATISGTSFYDTTGTTTATLNGSTQISFATSWSFTFPLNAGRYTVNVSNGAANASREVVVSSGGGSLICPATQPDCGMPQSFQKLMASQKPVETPVV